MAQVASQLQQQRQRQQEKKNVSNSNSVLLHKKLLIPTYASIVWIGLMTVGVIASNVGLTNAQLELQRKTTQISQINNKNSDLKQEISELSNYSRLEKVADTSGLTLNNKNIRNVTK